MAILTKLTFFLRTIKIRPGWQEGPKTAKVAVFESTRGQIYAQEGLRKYCFSFELFCLYFFMIIWTFDKKKNCVWREQLRVRPHSRETCLFVFVFICIRICREDSRQEKKDCVWEERGGVCYAASGTLVVGEEDPDPRTHTQYHWGCHQAKIHTLIPDIRHIPDTTQTLDTISINRT